MNENSNNVVGDLGKVQSALASALPQYTKFYVDAMKDGDDLYSYEDTEVSNNTLYHKAAASSGDCLTFSAVGGALQSAGVDCDTQLMPLCFRESGASDLSFFNNQCSQCSDTTAVPSCHQWVNLENYPTKDFTIKGAEICVKPCGPPVPFEDEYCQVRHKQASHYYGLILQQMVSV